MGFVQIIACFLCALLIISSCEKWDYEQKNFPEVRTIALEGESLTIAIATGQIAEMKPEQLIKAGHCWSSVSNLPALTDVNTKSVSAAVSYDLRFVSMLSNLLASETYYVRAYLIFETNGNQDTVYEERAQLLSTGKLGIVTSSVVQDGLSATVTSIIYVPFGEHITAFGHCWSPENPEPGIGNANVKEYGNLNADSTFQSEISQLEADKHYYVRAYAILNGQEYYGNTITFYTGDLWRKMADLPNLPNRIKASGFTLDNKLYIGLGASFVSPTSFETVPLNDWWCYDLGSGSWTQIGDYPGAKRYSAVAFVLGDVAYVGTGCVFDFNSVVENYSDFYAYYPASNVWVKKADFPDERSEAIAFTLGDRGYVGMGSWYLGIGSFMLVNNAFWAYDPDDATIGIDTNGQPLGRWIQKSPLPGTGRGGAVGFAIGQYGYVGFGRTKLFVDGFGCDSCVMNDFWQYDPSSTVFGYDVQGKPKGKWERKADMGDYGRYAAFSFSTATHGYVGGGSGNSAEPSSGSGVFNDLYQYHPLTDTWKLMKPAAGLNFKFVPAFSTAERGYVMYTSTSDTCSLWEYIPPK